MKVIDDNNLTLDAEVLIDTIENKKGLILKSRGGTKNSNSARNNDYFIALDIILQRLKNKKINIIECYIDSTESRNFLPKFEERQLVIDNYAKIRIQEYDPAELRKLICKSLSEKKQDPNKKGGNFTKRLFITTNETDLDWIGVIQNKKEKFNDDFTEVVINNEFDSNDIIEENEKALREITLRRGQKDFREKLLKIYNNKCAVTMTSVIQVLQAAHIIPYKGVLTNHLTNGIILRSDIHDLFDLNLIGIDTNYKIVVSSLLKETEYESFNGLKIQLPSNIKLYPSIEALKTRPLPFRN